MPTPSPTKEGNQISNKVTCTLLELLLNGKEIMHAKMSEVLAGNLMDQEERNEEAYSSEKEIGEDSATPYITYMKSMQPRQAKPGFEVVVIVCVCSPGVPVGSALYKQHLKG